MNPGDHAGGSDRNAIAGKAKLMTARAFMVPESVCLIIPQFNQVGLTLQAIRTLRKFDPVRWPIVVVDNGSSPDSIRQLHELRDTAVQVLTQKQAGLTSAWNFAARRSQADYLIFLNNDTLSSGPWVESLLAPLRLGTAIVSGVATRREAQLTAPVDLLSGWCFALRRETFVAVDGFDPAMQLYFSDTDFLLRVRERLVSGATSKFVAVKGLPISHIGHATAHQLPSQKSQWQADRKAFLARWQESR